MLQIMLHGAAGKKWQSLKLKGIMLQHARHENAASEGGYFSEDAMKSS